MGNVLVAFPDRCCVPLGGFKTGFIRPLSAVLHLLCYAKQECRRERIINMAIPKRRRTMSSLRPLHLEGTAKKKDDGTVKVNSTRSRFLAKYEPVTESEYLDSVTSNEN